MDRFLPNSVSTDDQIDSSSVIAALLHFDKLQVHSSDALVYFAVVFTLANDSKLATGICVDDLAQFHEVQNRDIGSESLRFSALIRNLCAIYAAKSVVIVTNHPKLQPEPQRNSVIAIECHPGFRNVYSHFERNSGDEGYARLARLVFDAHPTKLRDILASDDKPELYFLGLLNTYDQELFMRSEVSLSFIAASFQFANSFAESGRLGCAPSWQ